MVDIPTWTEAEAKSVADFINFVHSKAEFPSCTSPAEARKLTLFFDGMAGHLRKVESYILEFKKSVPAPKANEE